MLHQADHLGDRPNLAYFEGLAGKQKGRGEAGGLLTVPRPGASRGGLYNLRQILTQTKGQFVSKDTN